MATTTDPQLLASGLRSHGYTVHQNGPILTITRGWESGTYDTRNGRLTLPRSWDSQEFKRAYSHAVIEQKAQENGWELEWGKDEDGNEQATVRKDI